MLRDYFGGKHVLVTGGSSGIGEALARQLVDLGASLTLIARREGPLADVKSALEGRGPKIRTLPLDVASQAGVEAALPPLLEAHPPDMLINNAGIATPGRFLEQDPAEFRRHMDVNYFGMVHMTRAVAPRMVARGGGHIANVGSLLSVMGIYGYAAYAASKFAMQGFTECVRGELKAAGIRVTMLQPPDTDTPQHAAELAIMPPETRAIAGSVKMLSAEDVARALLEGMARNRFEVIPGLEGRATVAAHRVLPGLVRWVCDRSQRKAERPRPGSGGGLA